MIGADKAASPVAAKAALLVKFSSSTTRLDMIASIRFLRFDPVIPDTLPQNMRMASIAASVALYQEDRKVMESPAVRAGKLSTRGAGILPVWLQIPLKQVKPGQYTCQVNVIDEFGRKFAFPRMSLAVLPAVVVGRAPWPARVPLGPLFHPRTKPAGGPAAGQGARPTWQ